MSTGWPDIKYGAVLTSTITVNVYELCMFPSERVTVTVWVPISPFKGEVKVKIFALSKVMKLLGIDVVMVILWPSASAIVGS